jgi:hypothetical protein
MEQINNETVVADYNPEAQLYDHEDSVKVAVDNDKPKEENESVKEEGSTETPSKEAGIKEAVKEEIALKLANDSLIDEGVLKSVEEFAKANNLSNESAQKLLDNQNDLIKDYISYQQEEYQKEVSSWVDKLKSDKDFGGEKFNENVELAKMAFQKYADTETKELFEEKGYGNYPGLVKLFARIGRELQGDTFVKGISSSQAPRSIEDLFYGKNN